MNHTHSRIKNPQISSLGNLFEAFNHLNVLIIGDIMIDAYLVGSVDRISPEAPVPVVNVKSNVERLGGAANVALNIQSLGATPLLISVVGEDQAGNNLMNLLEQSNLSSSGIIVESNRPTTVKTRVISGSQQLLRIDQETEALVHNDTLSLLREKILELIGTADVIIFEDYDKGVISPELISFVVDEAKKLNIPVAVDPKKRNFNAYKEVDLFKPNLKELKEGLKIDFKKFNEQRLKAAAAKLKNEQEIKTLLITLSEKGIYYERADNHAVIPAHFRRISDVSGAGDTVISVAALCLALNVDISILAELANLSGGLVCEEIGVVPINKNKLLFEAQKHIIWP